MVGGYILSFWAGCISVLLFWISTYPFAGHTEARAIGILIQFFFWFFIILASFGVFDGGTEKENN